MFSDLDGHAACNLTENLEKPILSAESVFEDLFLNHLQKYIGRRCNACAVNESHMTQVRDLVLPMVR